MINNDDLDFKGETIVKNGKIKKLKKVSTDTSYSSFSNYIGLFKLFLLLGFVFFTIRILFSGNSLDFSFVAFIENLQSLPSVSTSFKNFFSNIEILDDWGLLNFLRDFINSFVDLTSIIWWLGGALIDVILFISAFLKMLFL